MARLSVRDVRIAGSCGRRLLCLAALAAVTGCSAQAWKRTSYETLQNINQQQCQETPGTECERQSYDDYQKMREDTDESR